MSKVHSTKCCRFQVLGTVAVICSSPIDHDVPRTPAVNLQVQQDKFMDNTLNKSELINLSNIPEASDHCGAV